MKLIQQINNINISYSNGNIIYEGYFRNVKEKFILVIKRNGYFFEYNKGKIFIDIENKELDLKYLIENSIESIFKNLHLKYKAKVFDKTAANNLIAGIVYNQMVEDEDIESINLKRIKSFRTLLTFTKDQELEKYIELLESSNRCKTAIEFKKFCQKFKLVINEGDILKFDNNQINKIILVKRITERICNENNHRRDKERIGESITNYLWKTA